jgi:hypothetical protein
MGWVLIWSWLSTAMPRASGQIRGKSRASALSALTAALLAPAAALGSAGEITRAFADADWTRGDIATMVSWSACTDSTRPSDCAWIPYATIGPGASESECASPDRDWPDLGEGVVLAFWDGEHKGPGTSKYESPMVSLRGLPGQLLCLFAIERTQTSGFFPSQSLDAALLTVPPPGPETEEPALAEEPASSEESPTSPPTESEPPAEGELPGPPEEPAIPSVEGEAPGLLEEAPKPPTGEISRAFADADRTRGDIAGSVTWNGCARTVVASTSYCAWIPYATIGPGASGCASPDRRWSSLGADVSLALWGGEAVGAGVDEFDFPGIWLDAGSDRLLCLAVIEVTEVGAYSHQLAAALLTSPPMAISDAKAIPEN